ncbi:MAG: MobC family plasmid mobilization relaxosome protein, partial [Sediminibacterium sp.]|nr:MobC family plasmid mobilization relaxosome protein [Sediminibacterium sp.]
STEKKTLLTASENEGYTISDFMRLKSIHAIPRGRKATPERAADIRGLAELSKVGSNLNQIARALNRRQDSPELKGFSVGMIEQVLSRVDSLASQLLTLAEHGH